MKFNNNNSRFERILLVFAVLMLFCGCTRPKKLTFGNPAAQNIPVVPNIPTTQNQNQNQDQNQNQNQAQRDSDEVPGVVVIVPTQPKPPQRTAESAITPACSAGQVYSNKLMKCLKPLEPYEYVPALPDDPNAPGNYVYDPNNSSYLNHGRTLANLYAGSGELQVVGATALAGALSGITFRGVPLVAAGGYGSAGAIFSHDWVDGHAPNECDNPTETGSRAGATHTGYGSKTWIEEWWQVPSYTGFATKTSIVDFVPPGEVSEDSGAPMCRNNRTVTGRGFWLEKWVTAGWSKGGVSFPNTLNVAYRYTIPEYAQNMDLLLSIYLRRPINREYMYDYRKDLLVEKMRGSALRFQPERARQLGYSNPGAENQCLLNTNPGNHARIMSSGDKTIAIGMLAFPLYNQYQVDYPVLFSVDHRDRYAPNYPHKFRIISNQHVFKNVPAGTVINENAMFFFGSVAEVRRDIQNFCRVSGWCSQSKSPMNPIFDPSVFDVDVYRELNPDLAGVGITSDEALMWHWLTYGAREGRGAHIDFYSAKYLNKNQDILDYATVDSRSIDLCAGIRHYVEWGKSEGRAIY